MLCLRSGEFENSARAFSVHHACQFWIRAFWKLWVCREVSAPGWTAQPLPGKGAALLTLSFLRDFRGDLGVMVRIPALIFIELAGWCIGKHPAASLFITFLAAIPGWCQVLNQNGLLVWLIYGWFCIPTLCYSDSQMEPHLPPELHSQPLHLISSYIYEDTCICSLGGLPLLLKKELLYFGCFVLIQLSCHYFVDILHIHTADLPLWVGGSCRAVDRWYFMKFVKWMLSCPYRRAGCSHWSLPFQTVEVLAGSCFPLWQVYFHLLQWWELAAAHREAQWTETLQMPTLLLWDQTHRGAGCSPSRWAQGNIQIVFTCSSLLFANALLVYLHVNSWIANLTLHFFPFPSPDLETNSMLGFASSVFYYFFLFL